MISIRISLIFFCLGYQLSGFVFYLNGDSIQKNFFQSEMNWTQFSLSVRSHEVIPSVDVNSSIHNLNQARRISIYNSTVLNRSKLSNSLEALVFNEDYSLGEYLEEYPHYKDSYLRYFNSKPESTTRFFEKKNLVLTSKLGLLGKGSLVALFYKDWGGDDLPEVKDNLPEEKHTGFILDARGLNIQPSLFPKIQTEDGRDILNTYIAYPAAIQEIGLVQYSDSDNQDQIRKRVGLNPMRMYPIYIRGKNKTNLVIPFEDTKKIIGSSTNRKNWRLCKIIVLIDPPIQ